MARLDQTLISTLAERLVRDEALIRSSVSKFAAKHGITSEAALAVYCKEHNIGCAVYLRKLPANLQDQVTTTLRTIRENNSVGTRSATKKILRAQKKPNRVCAILINYQTADPFRKGHVEEINRAYNAACYTCVFVLLRKFIENALIDILRHKFPEISRENKELYFDTGRNRPRDFDVIVRNLKNKSTDFGMDKTLVAKIADRAFELKEDANDKAHSWFHLVVRKKEVDDFHIQNMIDLIARLEKKIGLNI